MAKLEKSIEIKAPVTEAFALVVAEWEGDLSFWQGGVYDWEPSERPMGDGFVVSYLAKILGLGYRIEMSVQDFQANRGWTAVSRKGPETTGTWRFEALDGSTRFTYRLEYSMPLPLVGGLLDKLLLAPRWARIIDRSLEHLKILVERGTDR